MMATNLVWTLQCIFNYIYDRLDARFDMDLVRNKLAAVALVALTIPCMALDGDATATVFMAMIAVPMFFSRKPWIA